MAAALGGLGQESLRVAVAEGNLGWGTLLVDELKLDYLLFRIIMILSIFYPFMP